MLRFEVGLDELGASAPRGPVVVFDWRTGAVRRADASTRLSFELGARTLRAFADEASVRMMTKTLRDRRVPADVHAMIVNALAAMPSEEIDEVLVDLLRSKSPEVVLEAIDALAERGHTGHVRELERLERSREPAVRRAAGWGLALLLVAVYPANVWMAMAGVGGPAWAMWARLPLQGVLVAWALAASGAVRR